MTMPSLRLWLVSKRVNVSGRGMTITRQLPKDRTEAYLGNVGIKDEQDLVARVTA
jgi:hypothetical protein